MNESEAAQAAAWVAEELDVTGGEAAVRIEAMDGGASNEVHLVTLPGERILVLRCPPPVRSHPTAHDVVREHRILEALTGTGARVPLPVAVCTDEDVIGRPFYLMERIDGAPVRYSLPGADAAAPDTHSRFGEELMDAIAEVHAVDWKGVGLGDLGRPEGYLERQPARWRKQLDTYRVRDLPAVEAVGDWLTANLPVAQEPALVHGDYKLDNVLYAPESPPRIAAVVDWEMATIGDPLVDVAWALMFWPEAGDASGIGLGGAGTPGGISLDGLVSRAELAARYGERTGRDVSGLDYYTVLAAWKLAIVLEGNYARFVKGKSTHPMHAAFEFMVPALLDLARTSASLK